MLLSSTLPYIENVDSLPFPAYDVVDFNDYLHDNTTCPLRLKSRQAEEGTTALPCLSTKGSNDGPISNKLSFDIQGEMRGMPRQNSHHPANP